MRRPGGRDVWGQPLPGTEHTIAGCAFAPRATASVGLRTTEETYQSEQVITSNVLYAPVGADVGPEDVIVRADGSRWQVVGEPASWRSPLSGWRAGTEIPLQKVTG